VASRANIHLQFLPRAAGDKTVAATARDGGGDVLGVNAVFHGKFFLRPGSRCAPAIDLMGIQKSIGSRQTRQVAAFCC
jgi:hypothetical protein